MKQAPSRRVCELMPFIRHFCTPDEGRELTALALSCLGVCWIGWCKLLAIPPPGEVVMR